MDDHQSVALKHPSLHQRPTQIVGSLDWRETGQNVRNISRGVEGLPLVLRLALVDAMTALGKPIVILLRNGRALALEGNVKNAQAIVVTWFLGEQMGHAVADVLFGDHGPSARLPVSFPHKSGQQPYSYDHKSTGRPANPDLPIEEYKARYRETTNTALYPFGHGLTYGEVGYGQPQLSSPTLAWDGEIQVSVEVANAGSMPVVETVQLYIHDRVASLTQPRQRLRAFEKVDLAPGQTRTVTFTLDRSRLEFIGADGRPMVQPGTFDLWLAPSAQWGDPVSFVLTR